ncbi:MAG: hypothetical protein IH948_02990, partial [Bacteroidetes bacterium]|nr:hypothetical protein [Bacteroidota bacterium]
MLLFTCELNAQNLNNWQRNSYPLHNDTIQLDSLSLIPGSLILYTRLGKQINDSLYSLNHTNSSIILLTGLDTFKKIVGDTITAEYRTFTINFNKRYFHKNINVLESSEKGMINPFMYAHKPKSGDLFLSNSLNKSGSISRGVTIGNNQDLAVNSNLDLQISGKLNERIRILAAITDRNIPIQPDGTTVQIQEFDRAYIQLYDDRSKLTVGDFRVEEKTDHFMTFLKKARGGLFETTTSGNKIFKKDTSGVYQSRISGAISKGKFSRFETMGREGIQGPYKVRGANNELFIVVLSGTERIFIDGELMKRGQDHDYIINYNTAEITFTAKRMITKDKRIVIEFQYSDRNYVRSMINVASEYKSDNFKIGIKYYSEQDNKNQPLQQDLTDSNKLTIAGVGDNVQNAVINSMVEVPFTNSEVLYRLVDTLTYTGVLVYLDSIDTSAYRATFSNVGFGNGDYIQTNTSANGKVFQWVAPVLGISQGSYAPKTILAAPGKKQLVSVNTEFNISKRTRAIINLAGSDNDVNLFSTDDKGNDVGYAFHVKLLNERTMFKDTSEYPWKLKTHVSFEQLDKNFTSIERFRTVEFQRDWNLQNNTFNQNQYLGEVVVNLVKKDKGNFLYRFNSFKEAEKYSIFKNDFISDFESKGYRVEFKGSYLETNAIRNNSFLRLKSHVSKSTRKFTIGMKEEYEKNLIDETDTTFSNRSYEFLAWEGYFTNADSAINNYKITYKRRLDKGILRNSLRNATLGQHVGFSADIKKNKNSIFKSTTEFRILSIIKDSIGINQAAQEDKTLVNRIEYLVKLGKGLVSARSFYEIVSGLEVKKEFQFIE